MNIYPALKPLVKGTMIVANVSGYELKGVIRHHTADGYGITVGSKFGAIINIAESEITSWN